MSLIRIPEKKNSVRQYFMSRMTKVAVVIIPGTFNDNFTASKLHCRKQIALCTDLSPFTRCIMGFILYRTYMAVRGSRVNGGQRIKVHWRVNQMIQLANNDRPMLFYDNERTEIISKDKPTLRFDAASLLSLVLSASPGGRFIQIMNPM